MSIALYHHQSSRLTKLKHAIQSDADQIRNVGNRMAYLPVFARPVTMEILLLDVVQNVSLMQTAPRISPVQI